MQSGLNSGCETKDYSIFPSLGMAHVLPHSGLLLELYHLSSPFWWVFFFKILKIYLLRDREREAQTQAEGEAGFMQGARRGT